MSSFRSSAFSSRRIQIELQLPSLGLVGFDQYWVVANTSVNQCLCDLDDFILALILGHHLRLHVGTVCSATLRWRGRGT